MARNTLKKSSRSCARSQPTIECSVAQYRARNVTAYANFSNPRGGGKEKGVECLRDAHPNILDLLQHCVDVI